MRPSKRHRHGNTFVIVAILFVLGAVGIFFLANQFDENEKTSTELKVDNPKEPVDRSARTVELRAAQQYATINIPFPSIAMNKSGHIIGYEKREDGNVDMMLWIAGDTFNISEITGEVFDQILDVNDFNEVLGVINRDGKVYLKGFNYSPLKNQQIQIAPLNRVELRRFGLEDLTIETDLTLDSTLSEVQGRKVKVRSIIDMTDQGMILGNQAPEPSAVP